MPSFLLGAAASAEQTEPRGVRVVDHQCACQLADPSAPSRFSLGRRSGHWVRPIQSRAARRTPTHRSRSIREPRGPTAVACAHSPTSPGAGLARLPRTGDDVNMSARRRKMVGREAAPLPELRHAAAPAVRGRAVRHLLEPSARKPVGGEIDDPSRVHRGQLGVSTANWCSRAGGSFCAGADIKDMPKARAPAQTDPRRAVALGNRRFGDVLCAAQSVPVPLLVVAEGAVLGGGFGLVCVSDIAFGLPSARFGLPETGLGLIPAQIAPFVVQRVGVVQARRLMLNGARSTRERRCARPAARALCGRGRARSGARAYALGHPALCSAGKRCDQATVAHRAHERARDRARRRRPGVRRCRARSGGARGHAGVPREAPAPLGERATPRSRRRMTRPPARPCWRIP